MRFFISRTSQRGYSDIQPCEEAVQISYIYRERRMVDDPRKLPAFKHEPEKAVKMWYGEGTNHRIENGIIVRDRGECQAWIIEIDTLEQLMGLHDKYGEIIITEQIDTDEPLIEIYDDYREG